MDTKAIKKATFAVFKAGESFADSVRKLKATIGDTDFHTVLHTLIVACDEFYYNGAGSLYTARTRGADIGLGIAYNKDHTDYAMRQKQINRIMQSLGLTETRNPSSKPKKRTDKVALLLARIHKELTPAQIRALKAAL
jgi:predicted DNA binding protein